MKTFLSFAFALISLSTQAAPEARIVSLEGIVTFQGKPVQLDTRITGDGEFKVGEKSVVKIFLSESRSTVVLGANTTSLVLLAHTPGHPNVNLAHGSARWISGDVKSNKIGGGIRTKNAMLTLKGTDFLASYHPLLGETETVCFDGTVQLRSTGKADDEKLVSKNQWSGIGGRFGSVTAGVLSLSPEVITYYQKQLPR
ncbi:MAG TPA: hypothetical protein VNJ01_08105 [Bacteriovoracaceae bacterium]|nr:hypothetical protein [Bacteriovoracaceae bacterium]